MRWGEVRRRVKMWLIVLILRSDSKYRYCMFAVTGIKSVSLPRSLTSLADNAFDDDVEIGPPTHPLLVQNKSDEISLWD